MDFSKLLHRVPKIDTMIFPSSYMDLPNLLYGYVKDFKWICQTDYMFSSPLPNKTKLKFDPVEASALYLRCQSTQCLWSVVPLAMFLFRGARAD